MLLSTPWMLPPAALAEHLLFHGTAQRWDRVSSPRVSSLDNCLWTAESPAIAQAYIPAWRETTRLVLPEPPLDARQVRPAQEDIAWGVARMLGARAQDVIYDSQGRAASWAPCGKPVSYADVRRHLVALGYTPDLRGVFNINSYVEEMAAGCRLAFPVARQALLPGRLVLIEPGADLRIKPVPSRQDLELSDLQYHCVTDIRAAFAAGYGSVRIDDFYTSGGDGECVRHPSIGLSHQALDLLGAAGRIVSIPATHHGLRAGAEDGLTEDFLRWHFSEVCRGLAGDQPVPAAVLEAHAQRFDALLQSPQASIQIPVAIDAARHIRPAPGQPPRGAAAPFSQGQLAGDTSALSQVALSVDPFANLSCSRGTETLAAVQAAGLCVGVPAVLLGIDGLPFTGMHLRAVLGRHSFR